MPQSRSCLGKVFTLLVLALLFSIFCISAVSAQHVWSKHSPVMNPCHERAAYPHICSAGWTCVNTGPGVGECVLDPLYPVPSSVQSNIKVWFDASDLNGNGAVDSVEGYSPVGGVVATWTSRVGGIVATAQTSPPPVDATHFGGVPSIHFTSHYFSTAPVTVSADSAVFMVIEMSSSGIQVMLEQSVTTDSNPGHGFIPGGSALYFQIRRTTAIFVEYPTWNGLINTKKLGVFYSDGTHFKFRTNGVHELSNGVCTGDCMKPSGNFAVSDAYYIGCRSGGAYCLQGYIAEIIIIDGVLPLADIQSIEAYLKNKYGIV